MANFIRGGTRIYGTPRFSAGSLEGRDALERAQDEGSPRGDTYLTALLKLVPAEVISIYMAIRDSAVQHKFLAGWFVLCLLTCIVFRAYSNLPDKANSRLRDVQWRSVLVSAIAFFLWAFAISSDPPIPAFHLEQWLASALAALFGVLAPLFVPADTPVKAGGS